MNHRNLLDESYPLSQHHIDFYRTNGFIKLKNVLEADTLKHYGQLISQKVVENTQNVNALSDRDTYGKAFLQIFNLWREDKDIKKFIFSKRLAKIATQLMEVKGVRMYHDQALIPVKALAFEEAVNVTLGLPIVRTSVDHGTALDIAWQGKADASSLKAAVNLTVRLSQQA